MLVNEVSKIILFKSLVFADKMTWKLKKICDCDTDLTFFSCFFCLPKSIVFDTILLQREFYHKFPCLTINEMQSTPLIFFLLNFSLGFSLSCCCHFLWNFSIWIDELFRLSGLLVSINSGIYASLDIGGTLCVSASLLCGWMSVFVCQGDMDQLKRDCLQSSWFPNKI